MTEPKLTYVQKTRRQAQIAQLDQVKYWLATKPYAVVLVKIDERLATLTTQLEES